MAHVGQEHGLGVGCVLGLLSGQLQFALKLLASFDIFMDRARHRMHGLT